MVLEVGAEGGSISLCGYESEKGWSFSRTSNQNALIAMLEEDGEWSKKADARRKDNLRRYEEERFDSLDFALGMLDKEYPGWTQLYPLTVHPAFREEIFDALHYRARFYGQFVDWWQWGHVLSPEHDYSWQIRTISFDPDFFMWLDLVDGRLIGIPLDWYPSMQKAPSEQLARYHLSPAGIHWDELGIDLWVAALLTGCDLNWRD